MQYGDLVLDAGNGDIKYTSTEVTAHYSHNLAELSEGQWRDAVGVSQEIPHGYIAIDGRYYVYGDKARRYQLKVKPSGAGRYHRHYYGVLMCCAIAEAYAPDVTQINLFASHAPRDNAFKQSLMDSASGRWQFQTGGGTYSVNVRVAGLFDEPLGGLYHKMLTNNIRISKNSGLINKTVLVIDVGSFTVDYTAIERNGEVDLTSMTSTQTGTRNVTEAFVNSLKRAHTELFQTGAELDSVRVFDAIMSGAYMIGRKKLNVKTLRDSAMMTLVNDVMQIINQMGGAVNYDALLLTGGGGMLVLPYLEGIQKSDKGAFSYLPIYTADNNLEHMRYANVQGGAKFYMLLKERNLV